MQITELNTESIKSFRCFEKKEEMKFSILATKLSRYKFLLQSNLPSLPGLILHSRETNLSRRCKGC